MIDEARMFDSATKSVVDIPCRFCDATGIEPCRVRAACRMCDGTGRFLKVYHDCSMFAGRDLRGKVRVSTCPIHGDDQLNPWGVPDKNLRCCDKSTLRLATADDLALYGDPEAR